MDANRFDGMTRLLGMDSTRRTVLSGLATAFGIGLAGLASSPGSARKRKLQRNRFGCVNVGGKCRRRNSVCCSGICDGKKSRKGEKDKSRCVGHDEQGCRAGQIEGFCGGTNVSCTTSTGDTAGNCDTTTGNAGYCSGQGQCVAGGCKKDADCIPVFGAGAACVLCDGCPDGTGCAGLD